jgi:hypothetical protein
MAERIRQRFRGAALRCFSLARGKQREWRPRRSAANTTHTLWPGFVADSQLLGRADLVHLANRLGTARNDTEGVNFPAGFSNGYCDGVRMDIKTAPPLLSSPVALRCECSVTHEYAKLGVGHFLLDGTWTDRVCTRSAKMTRQPRRMTRFGQPDRRRAARIV